jgi:hypothetical protein
MRVAEKLDWKALTYAVDQNPSLELCGQVVEGFHEV